MESSKSLYDRNLPLNSKRGRVDLGAENARNGGGDPQKRSKPNVNPWNYKPYTNRYYEILETRKKLPAWEARDQLTDLVKKHQCIILQGETGSGKTTQIPQFLLEAGYATG